MNEKEKGEIRFREKFENYGIQPSPRVWEAIEAASPKPLARLRNLRYLWIGAAALLVITAVLLIRQQRSQTQISQHLAESVQTSGNQPLTADEQEGRTYTDNTQISSSARQSLQQPASGNTASIQAGNSQGISQPMVPKNAAGSPLKINLNNSPLDAKTVQLPQNPSSPVKINPSVPKGSDPAGNTAVAPKTQITADTPALKVTPQGSVEVFIPNAFAPGSNGVNDFFMPVIQNNAPVKDYRMQIFARSGQLLFESTSVDMGWDGRFQGAIVDDHVCVYLITFRDTDGFSYVKKGTVTLIR